MRSKQSITPRRAELARQRYYDAPDRFTRPGPDAGDFEDASDPIATALVDRIRESDGEPIGDGVDITFADGRPA